METKNMDDKETIYDIKLGIFVTIGLLLFIAAIYFIGSRQHLFSKTFNISTQFKDINGLQIGNNVRFSGINIGTVKDIQIVSDSLVQVEMEIEKSTQKFIKIDSKAFIGSEGLMGNKVLNISPGTPNNIIVKNNDIIRSKQLASIDDIMLKIDSVATNAVYITSDIKDMTGNIQSGKGTLGKLFMDESMASNIDQTLINAKQSTANLNENLEALKSNILFKKGFKKKEKEAKKIQEKRTEDSLLRVNKKK